MKKLIITAILAFVAYWFASPYWVSYQIEQAVKNNDAAKLSSYIDFEQLKQSLKTQLEREMQQKLADNSNPQVEAFAQMFAGAFLDKMLDSMISPQGIQMMIQGKQAYENNPLMFETSQQSSTTAMSSADQTRDEVVQNEPNYSGAYDGLNRFVIAQDQPEGQKAGFVLTRDGMSWKMTEIVMPNTKP